MKIAFDGYVLRFPRTGIVNYGFAVARGYRQCLASDDVRILVGDRNVTDDEIRTFLESGDVVPIFENHSESLIEKVQRKLSGNVFRNYLPGLRSAIAKATDGFDVYHCTDWFFEPSRHAKVNAITVFDFTTTLFPQFHEELNITKERMKLNRLSAYDFVFCISEATRNDLLQHTSVDPAKAIVNYIGADPVFDSRSYIPRDVIASKYKIPEGRRYILSVSTIEPRKNFLRVLEAFEYFLRHNPDSPHVLVCTGMWGWKNDELRDYLAQCDFADRVVFTGFAELADLPSLYHHADCFLYLSLYEGFGLPILEAMKSGCPVICSNTSSMPEVIGDTGTLVSPFEVEDIASAIATVVQDLGKADRMRAAGLMRSELFSWDRHLDCLMETFTEAAQC